METNSTVNALAKALKQSKFLTASIGKNQPHRIHCIDFSRDKSIPSNFLDGSINYLTLNQNQHILLREMEWLSSDRLHNTFFVEPYRQYTHIDEISIQICFKGIVKLSVYQVSENDNEQLIFSQNLQSVSLDTFSAPLVNIHELAPNTRLYWHIRTLDGIAEIKHISFSTQSKPTSDGRLLVLLRTYGRSDDIIRLLDQFDSDFAQNAPELTKLFYFVVLDSSDQAENPYQSTCWKNIQSYIFHANNLGGGGNISHLLHLTRRCFSTLECAPDEVLILDDDLHITTETLLRYFYFVCFRHQEVITSLPIFMKSKTKRIWEDGGYWGRLGLNKQQSGFQRESLFPTLLKHGLTINENQHLPLFAQMNRCEYSTFIFFGLSYASLLRLKYPAALFLRGDDIELSLQAQALNIPLFTNPNLAAWHEPGHSYAQEYMAILHGVLVNLLYGMDSCEPYIDFFEKRLLSHASICDDLGLKTYLKVLSDLNNPHNEILDLHFDNHYKQVINELNLNAQCYQSLAPSIVENIRKKQEILENTEIRDSFWDIKSGIGILPFLHFEPQKKTSFKEILLYNQHTNQYYPIDTSHMQQRRKIFQLKAQFNQQLAYFIEHFSSLSQQWRERLINSRTESFWTEVAKHNQNDCYTLQSTQLDQTKVQAQKIKHNTAKSLDSLGSLANASKTKRIPKVPTHQRIPSSANGLSLEDKANLPDGFDPKVYIELHEDLRIAGVDAIKHYLLHGRHEGRKWK